MLIKSVRKNHKRALGALLCLIMIITVLTGCGEDSTALGYRNVKGSVLTSQILSSNSNYELRWDSQAKAVVLKSLDKQNEWSDILYEAYLNDNITATGNSPIYITVINTKTLQWDTVKSYQAIEENGKIICKKIDNGIRVTYFFDAYKIAVPVDYTLRNDCLNVSVETSQILEDGTDYKLISITLTPCLCSVSDSIEGAYLFVPAGSGALMYSKETPDGVRTYSGEVYGADASRRIPNDYNDDEDIRLPVFGCADGNTAMMGIIEEGDACAFIDAQAGNERVGYSSVGATFYVRGYDTFLYGSNGTGLNVTNRVTENICADKVSVSYYPLFGENADYNGMAHKYRDYLLQKGLLQKSKGNSLPYSVSILGGTTVTKSILGVPKTELVALTDFKQSQKIIASLNDKYGLAAIRLLSFGNNGLTPGKVAGTNDFSSVYGTKDDVNSLKKLCADIKTDFFVDYDTVFFSKSGGGFSVNSDCAKTAIFNNAEQYPIYPTRAQYEDEPFYVLSPTLLSKVIDKVKSKANKYGFSNLSFSSLGEVSYSDFSKDGFELKKGIKNTVKQFQSLKKEGFSIAVSGANGYAANVADILFDVTATNGNYDAFDVQIPFYQMVFSNLKPMYTSAVNIAENADELVLNAAASGMGLGYTFSDKYISESNDLAKHKLYATVYTDNNDLIDDTLIKSGFYDCFKNTVSSTLIRYEISDNGLSRSIFDNGTVVYANHTSKPIETSVGLLNAYSFSIE